MNTRACPSLKVQAPAGKIPAPCIHDRRNRATRAAEGELTMLDYTKTWLAVRGITLFKDKRAVTALEYGLIASLIAVAIIVGVTALGGGLNTEFNKLSGNL
jgi:pilus assembly protein Flp/PilA